MVTVSVGKKVVADDAMLYHYAQRPISVFMCQSRVLYTRQHVILVPTGKLLSPEM